MCSQGCLNDVLGKARLSFFGVFDRLYKMKNEPNEREREIFFCHLKTLAAATRYHRKTLALKKLIFHHLSKSAKKLQITRPCLC
jgi:hypothetical protein